MHLSNVRVTRQTEQDSATTPFASFVLAYAAMIPIVVGAGGVWALRDARPIASRLTIEWSAGVLCFLSGVRRGLSFRQPGGSTLGGVAAVLCTFVLGTGALLSRPRVPSILLLLLGFGALRSLDSEAAVEGKAPRYFSQLRPAQMTLCLASLLVLLASECVRIPEPAKGDTRAT